MIALAIIGAVTLTLFIAAVWVWILAAAWLPVAPTPLPTCEDCGREVCCDLWFEVYNDHERPFGDEETAARIWFSHQTYTTNN